MSGPGLPAGSAGEPPGQWVPPGWLVPCVQPRERDPNEEGAPPRQRLKYPIYIPRTPQNEPSEPYVTWRKRYMNYAIDELRRGITRPELARELVNNCQGPLATVLLDVPERVVSDEGVAGRAAQGLLAAVPTRLSGLNALLGMIDTAYKEVAQEEESNARQNLDTFVREPGMNMTQFKLHFEHVVFMAHTVADVQWSDNYKTQKLLEKARIKEDQAETLMSRVDGDWRQFARVIALLVRLYPYNDGRVIMPKKDGSHGTGHHFVMADGTVVGGSGVYATSMHPSYSAPTFQNMQAHDGQYGGPPSGSPWDTWQTWAKEKVTAWAPSAWAPSVWASTGAPSAAPSYSKPEWSEPTFYDAVEQPSTTYNSSPSWQAAPYAPSSSSTCWPESAGFESSSVWGSDASSWGDDEYEEVHYDIDTGWCWSEESGWHWEEDGMIFYESVDQFSDEAPTAFQQGESGQIFKGYPKGKGKGRSKGKKGPKPRRYKPFSSSKGGWKGHPGGRPPARPNPGLCDICQAPDHWRDQCPKNPNARPKGPPGKGPPGASGKFGGGKKGGKATKGSIFGKPIHFFGPTLFLGMLSILGQVELGQTFLMNRTVTFLNPEQVFPFDVRAERPEEMLCNETSSLKEDGYGPPTDYRPATELQRFWEGALKNVHTAKLRRPPDIKVFVFAQVPGGSTQSWDSSWHALYKYKGHALLLDTGAATNLAGAGTVRGFDQGFLRVWGERVRTEALRL